MTKNIISRKSLVIGIIILFVSASVVPCISSINNNMLNGFVSSSSESFDPFEEGWQYRKQITIHHTKVEGDLVNFPALISVVDSDLQSKAQDDGDDILFMDNTGVANKLYHEIEFFDGSTGELVAWVNVTSLSSTSDTVIYLYYGNADCASQTNKEGVWDSDYVIVQHLNESSGIRYDSTSNNHDSTEELCNHTDNGKIDGADDFEKDTGSDRDTFGWLANYNTFTVEAWSRHEAIVDYPNLFGYSDDSPDIRRFSMMVYNNGKVEFYVGNNENKWGNHIESNPGVVSAGSWNYYVGTGTGANIYLYIDNQQQGSVANSNDLITDTFYIGRREEPAGANDDYYLMDGIVDEFRISRVIRTGAWLETCYNTMNDPSSFFSVGPEESPNNPPNPPSNPDPYDGKIEVDVNAILSWSCSDPDGDSLLYDVYLEKNDATPDILVSYHQSETFYDPPDQMEYFTDYYWQIVAWDPYDANTSGPVWHFVTTSEANNPPYEPSMPNPPNDATDVDIDIDLSWSCSDPDGDNLVYDVYFEADDPDPDVKVSDDQSENIFDPGILLYGTDYYWQIIAKDENGASTAGPIWHFITKEDPTNDPPGIPTINGPTSGKVGKSYTYSFIAVDPDSDDVSYEIDWGDGQVDPWDGPHPSNTIITRDHGWEEEGTFTIRARAKDNFDNIGDWGELKVTIFKKNKAFNRPFLNFLQHHPLLFPILRCLFKWIQ